MSWEDDQQTQAFAEELDRLCDRFSEEFDLNCATVCGVLLMKIREIQDGAIARWREEEGGDDDTPPPSGLN